MIVFVEIATSLWKNYIFIFLFSMICKSDIKGKQIRCQVRPDQICDLLQVPCKPVLTCFMVGLLMTNPSTPPDFLVRRVYDMDTQQD